MEALKFEVVFEPMKGLGGGFRQEWVSAKFEGGECGLDSGAGLGNPLMTFWVEPKGKKRQYFTADITKMVKALTEQAIA